MKHAILAPRTFPLAILAATVLLVAPGASIAVQRTFVHSPPSGNDANTASNCSLAFPCRSFNSAISVTDPGGEVVILDTAGYGSMTINKSIKIIGPSGVYGGISVVAGGAVTTGIVINAGNGDDITLRGLDISGVVPPGGVAPFPDIGIDIQNAGGVHIEKSSIGNFTQDTSACIKVNVASTVRVYVDDSFLRACRTGIYANGTVALANKPSVIVDNTRIERGRGAIVAYGVWVQGGIDVSLRNSMISRQDVGIQFDSLLSSNVSHVEVINSELTRNTTALNFVNAAAGAQGQIAINGSQIFGSTDAIKIANSAVGGNTTVSLMNSHIAYTGGSGIQMANSAADPNTRVHMEFVRSQINNITATAVDLNATNGSKVYFDARDSTASHAGTLIKTSGTSRVAVSLIRSDFRHTPTILDHGNGEVRIDGSHFVQCTQDFVNNGSGNMVSLDNNFVFDCDDLPGPTYITPTKIPTK
jgi:hypothetical protein